MTKLPLVNYCKKCKAEVPVGESCPYCTGKLTQTGEQISFGMKQLVVKDWFAWNDLLRVALPVLFLALVIILVSEFSAAGMAGVTALLSQGLMEMMLGILALVLLAVYLILHLQGAQSVHTVLDKQGVHVRIYIAEGNDLGLYSRFMTQASADRLARSDDRPPLSGLMLVKKISLPWNEVRRVRVWREGGMILFYRPAFWQAAAVRCPGRELIDAETFLRKKMKRFKKVKVLPKMAKEKKEEKLKLLRKYE